MRTLNILHISDSHIQKRDAADIKEIVKKLIDDIKNVQKQKDISIDLICFTGDLIQRGDKALKDEMQWELAMELLVNKLLLELDLPLDRFIIVPGNHEVDISKIFYVLEEGLQTKSLEKINMLLHNFDPSYRERLYYFYEFIRNQNSNVEISNLGYTYNKYINELNIGISCVDSAWRSSGKGSSEKGNLYLGIRELQELYTHIENSDIKICLMHHPVDWLVDSEILEVERELAKYDIVLRGHIHEEDLKQVSQRNLKTIFSTAGKLYPLEFSEGRAIDGYNGYVILNIEFDKRKCNVFFRNYYAKSRKEFDAGINICSMGEESYDICCNSDNWNLKFNVIRGIKQYFYNMSEKFKLINEADAKSPKDIRDVLIDPVLSDKSEYVKENNDEEAKEISIQTIMDTKENILLIGKKESGKTTILQQIGLKYINEYEVLGSIPVHINMKHLPRGTDRILNSTIHFIQNNILDDDAISKSDIIKLVESGKLVFLIDNVKTSDSCHTNWITSFVREYGNNRFVLTIEEDFFQSLDVKQIPEYGTTFKEVYIQYMGKSQIRAMVTKWARGREEIVNIDDTVNKIDFYCNQINFAKTPFNVAVFMVIWDDDNNFIPTNEGIIMENYLEIVLEKLSPKEALRSTYSFKLKQNFLSFLAYNMYVKDEYFFSKIEFDELVRYYHINKGYNVGNSRFDKLFFEKNILSYTGEYIVFSHTTFMEYFLALYIYNDKDFLAEITKKGNRIYFRNTICFYSGLEQNCIELLDTLSADIMSIVSEYIGLVDELNELQIMTEFKMDKEEFISIINNNRPTEEELDKASDNINIYIEKKPTEMKKKSIDEIDAEDFYSLLLMYGSILKNAELIDNNYKIKHLNYYMYGMNMLYAMMIKLFEYMNENVIYDRLSDEEKENLNLENKEDFDEMKSQLVDFTKLIFPIGIQNMILENVGTPKLEAAINELIKNKGDKAFEKFMLIFLKCDLKIVNLKLSLGKYIKDEKSKDILKITLMKLTFYYRVRFFGNNIQVDKDLIDLIAQIHMKLNPQKYQNYNKSLITQNIKFMLDNQS